MGAKLILKGLIFFRGKAKKMERRNIVKLALEEENWVSGCFFVFFHFYRVFGLFMMYLAEKAPAS